MAQSYEKGDNLDVVGALQQRTFTPKDGSQRTLYEVVVQHAHVIARNRRVTAEEEADPQGKEEVDAWAVL